MNQLTTNEKLLLMKEIVDNIISYLENEKSINEDALAAYNPQPIQDSDPEIRRMREREAIKLRDRTIELKRHISVIKKMYPNG